MREAEIELADYLVKCGAEAQGMIVYAAWFGKTELVLHMVRRCGVNTEARVPKHSQGIEGEPCSVFSSPCTGIRLWDASCCAPAVGWHTAGKRMLARRPRNLASLPNARARE